MAALLPVLRRRQLLRLGLGLGAGLGGGALLAACRAGGGPQLLVVRDELPRAWAETLPDPWRLQAVADGPALLAALAQSRPGPELVALGDGWASAALEGGASPGTWQPLEQPALLQRLAPLALAPSRLFAAAGPALAFPWAFSPWVIALRSRPDLAGQAQRGWELLLDPSLRGRLVLPSSPRLCIELMGGDFERIQRLRRQALAHDDRHGLSHLLAGEATAAVLPLRRLVPLLRRDPRLAVVWPSSGAPLSWQLLLRPAAARRSPPAAWLAACLQPPLLPQLLAAGWVPPLPAAALAPLLSGFPAPLRQLLAPAPALLERCWNLPPLDGRQRLALQSLWDAAAPAA